MVKEYQVTESFVAIFKGEESIGPRDSATLYPGDIVVKTQDGDFCIYLDDGTYCFDLDAEREVEFLKLIE
jgi:hypothetical protein